MYIDGSWVTADETRPVINPADESVIAVVPEADASHAEQALEAARRAQREWGRKSGPERGAALRAIAGAIRARREELARLVVAEQGKTITEARGEVGDAAAGFFDYYATFERAQVGSMFAPTRRTSTSSSSRYRTAWWSASSPGTTRRRSSPGRWRRP